MLAVGFLYPDNGGTEGGVKTIDYFMYVRLLTIVLSSRLHVFLSSSKTRQLNFSVKVVILNETTNKMTTRVDKTSSQYTNLCNTNLCIIFIFHNFVVVKNITAMNKNSFVYGVAVTGYHFIGREAETCRLKANFEGGINTILISPRRWGKTSLVKH